LGVLTFIASTLIPAVADSSTTPSESLVTCINLGSGRESISKTGSCISTQATAKWRLAKSDTALPTAPGSKRLIVCSNQESSVFAYRMIRKECPQHQVRSIYYRNASIPVAPVISIAEAYSDVSAAISLLSDSSGNPDAPIAHYTISISNGETRKVKSSSDLRFAIGGLKASTTYTFTVTSTNADGTSEASTPSKSVTTKEYVPLVVAIPASTPVALTCATGGTCVIGDTGPGGGKVFYVALSPFICGPTMETTCNYLEAAPSGWNSGSDPIRTWAQRTPVNYQSTRVGNVSTVNNATSLSIGRGYVNTLSIISQGNSNPSTSAATLAHSYSSTVSGITLNDWYLPTKNELILLYSQKSIVGGLRETLESYYWSSSESSNASFAWVQDFSDGWQGTGGKSDAWYVRPIRAF
jgi:hypothetical protein